MTSPPLLRTAWWLCLAMALTLTVAFAPAAQAADSVILSTRKVRLNAQDPKQTRVGRLDWRGGLAIASPDPRLGGLSALTVSTDGRRLTALSDQGDWLSAPLRYDRNGHLAGLGAGLIGPLTGLDGKALKSKKWKDAESLGVEPDGALLVAFERINRIWRYPPGNAPFAVPPIPLPPPPGLDGAPNNGGLEALVVLADGALLAIAEKQKVETGLAAYLFREGRWQTLSYRKTGHFSPTGAARLPGGDVVVLERLYRPPDELGFRLVQIPAAEIHGGAVLTGREIAELRPPLIFDNFEGIAARPGAGGETLLYLLSDDNLNPLQRTLLLMFALQP